MRIRIGIVRVSIWRTVLEREAGEAKVWLYLAPPPPPGWGVAFLRPALVQHGSAVVHHLCSGTAAAGEAGTPRWGPRRCGCCAVRGRRG